MVDIFIGKSSENNLFVVEQARKLGRCDSYLQNLKTLPTHCTMGQAMEIDILEVRKRKQWLHAHFLLTYFLFLSHRVHQ